MTVNIKVLAGYVEPKQLASELRRSVRTLDRWYERGIGPPQVRIGRLRLYKIEDVRVWLDASRKRGQGVIGQELLTQGSKRAKTIAEPHPLSKPQFYAGR